MVKKDYKYTGQENLEVMAEAVNYNNYQKKFLLAAINKLPSRRIRVLDFGAGIGTYADLLREDLPNLHIDCLEPTKKQADILQEKGYTVFRSIDEVRQKYDLVYSLNVLEHIEDDTQAVIDQKTILKNDGLIIAYVPAFMTLYGNLDRLVEHWRRYRVRDFKKIANSTGLRIVSIRYCDPAGFFAALVYNTVGGSGNLNKESIKIFDRYIFPVSVFCERLTGKFFGKNILVTFSKKGKIDV